jgi:ABC-type transporter Mla maintaining outer membrane lipid asymmetry ATPase subunit MlaF
MRIELQAVEVERHGKTILAGVDLVCEPGTLTVILGQSGAGLTTLLKVAAGLIVPTRGRVRYDGHALDSLDERARQALQTRTGFVFQDAALWANTDLLGNFSLPLRAKYPDLDADAQQRLIHATLNSWGFPADLKRRPAMLSHGQQKVASFLRALIPGPEAMFLDEPMSSMDRRWRQEVRRTVAELREAGVTVLAGGHDAELTGALADQVLVLEQGRVRAAGPADGVSGD